MADEGKCVGCGYLSWRRHNDDSSPFFEVVAQRRISGICPTSGDVRGVSNAPYCFRHALPTTEYEGFRSAGLGKPESFLTVIRAARGCDKYYKHCEGSTPEEHAEMELVRILAQQAKDAAELAARQANPAAEIALEQAKDNLAQTIERADRIRSEDKTEAERIRSENQEIVAAHNASERKLKIWLGILPVVVGLVTGPAGFFMGREFDKTSAPIQSRTTEPTTNPTTSNK